jgi:hypothetical protein
MMYQTQARKLQPKIRRQNGNRSAAETAMPPIGSCCFLTSPSAYMMKPSWESVVSLWSLCPTFKDCLYVHHQRWLWQLYSHATCIQGVCSRLLQRVLQALPTSSIVTSQIARENFTVNIQDSAQECNHFTALLHFTLLYVILRSLWIRATWFQISTKTRVCKLHLLHHHYWDTETWNHKLQTYIGI